MKRYTSSAVRSSKKDLDQNSALQGSAYEMFFSCVLPFFMYQVQNIRYLVYFILLIKNTGDVLYQFLNIMSHPEIFYVNSKGSGRPLSLTRTHTP